MAWDAIEAADLDELTFLLGATFIDMLGWDNHHGVRAILENRALRQLAGLAGHTAPASVRRSDAAPAPHHAGAVLPDKPTA